MVTIRTSNAWVGVAGCRHLSRLSLNWRHCRASGPKARTSAMSLKPYPMFAERMLLGVFLTAALGCGEKTSATLIPVINPPVPAPSRPMNQPPDAGPADGRARAVLSWRRPRRSSRRSRRARLRRSTGHPETGRRALRVRQRMRNRILPGGRLLQRHHLRPARPGRSLPARRPVRERLLRRRRLL